jgi:hypothetical protein
LIRHDISYKSVSTDDFFQLDNSAEHLAIDIDIYDNPLRIVNLYIPPATSCPPNFTPSLFPLFTSDADSLILGDFNAHHPTWYSATQDDRAAARGVDVDAAVEAGSLVTLNEDTPTRLPPNGAPSSPDISMISSHLALQTVWTTHTTLNSDHLPIVITIMDPAAGPSGSRRTYVNYRRADWETYAAETEASFSALPPPESCSTGEGLFRRVLLQAGKRCIPAGNYRNHIPSLTPEIKELQRQRDEVRAQNPADPALEALNNLVTQAIAETAQRVWETKISAATHTNPTQYWSLLRTLW